MLKVSGWENVLISYRYFQVSKRELRCFNIKPVHHKSVRVIFQVIRKVYFCLSVLLHLVVKHPKITQGELTFQISCYKKNIQLLPAFRESLLVKSAHTNLFLLNLHVFKTTTWSTCYKIYVQAEDRSITFTGGCLKYIYVLVTWEISHIAHKGLWMSNTLKYFPKRNWWSYKAFILF